MTQQPDSTRWHPCSSCKKSIGYGEAYYVCSVSTCNRKRTGLVFCSVSCWDAHVPMMNHRESWAEERRAPSRDEWVQMLAEDAEPKKRRPRESAEPSTPAASSVATTAAPRTILRRNPK